MGEAKRRGTLKDSEARCKAHAAIAKATGCAAQCTDRGRGRIALVSTRGEYPRIRGAATGLEAG